MRLRFSPTVARYVREKLWHPTQKTEEHADGSLILTVQVNHFLEVSRWILSFGPECEVFEPGDLREQIMDSLSRALATYQSKVPTAKPRRKRKLPSEQRDSPDLFSEL